MNPIPQPRHIASGFIAAVKKFPSRDALVVNDEALTYATLGQRSSDIAATLAATDPHHSLVAVLASRSATAYASILGTLIAGRGYVPLNPKFPLERTRQMLDISQCSTLLVGRECIGLLKELLAVCQRPLTAILPDAIEAADLEDLSAFAAHRIVAADAMQRGPAVPNLAPTAPDAIAYLLFTSGSTGAPKGVPISHASASAYIRYICERYGVDEEDRVSQVFDLTFDLSVHDIFVCWERGACLFPVPEKAVMAPAKFIRERQLTMWFSVPSAVVLMAKLRMLKADSLPSLRCSLFCGEPLAATAAAAWQQAAPNSVVENLYGPTEATIAISHFRWPVSNRPEQTCLNGIVPIGWIFPGQKYCIVGPAGEPLKSGQTGELCLAGSQVTTAYWRNPDRTAQSFVKLPFDAATLWYKTGDLVRQDSKGCMYYMGRKDQQIKIRGYRVELQEIDYVLKQAAKTEEAVSVAWPVTNGSAEGIIAFVGAAEKVGEAHILSRCRQTLPDYMVPRKIHFVSAMPLNANGKINRRKLLEDLEV